ncbi:MAG: RNA polymerase sigma factor [Bacteroidales bacterium]|nr:RNA polymerase sigma factor [Bacteroidales bacterium]
MTDEEIIAGCRKGKRKYQEALYNKYGGMLLGVCNRYLSAYADAEDVFQEAFIKIFKNISTFRNQSEFSLQKWMKRIMINTAINFIREKKKASFTADSDFSLEFISDEQDPAFFDDLYEMISAEEILEIVQKLPDGYRMVFNLYAMESCSHDEIAKMLGVSVNTSKTQLHKARKKIIAAIQYKLEKQLYVRKIV